MEKEEIARKLDEYIREHFEIEEDDPGYSMDTDLFEEGYCDSFGSAEIIDFIRSSFGVEIRLRDITRYPMNSVNEIADVVWHKMRGEA